MPVFLNLLHTAPNKIHIHHCTRLAVETEKDCDIYLSQNSGYLDRDSNQNLSKSTDTLQTELTHSVG